MKSSIRIFLVLTVTAIVIFAGCQLNPQSAKEKMAYNNFMNEIKATNFMEGKIGNIKYEGNAIKFDFTDTSMSKDDMTEMMYRIAAIYANTNNKAQTGITILRFTANRGGQTVCKATYQAGPSLGDDVSSNVKLQWFGEFAGTETPPKGTAPADSTTPGATSGTGTGTGTGSTPGSGQ